MAPYAKSFLSQNEIQEKLKKSGFDYIYGDKSSLENLKHNDYILIGKEFPVQLEGDYYSIDENLFVQIINDIKGVLFETYKSVLSKVKNQELETYQPKIAIDLDNLPEVQNEVDYIEQYKNQMEIGLLAEKIVLENEIDFLRKDFPDLANKVRSVANNPKFGFDILSFETNGNQKQIEVKAISVNKETKSFILTRNEFDKSKTYSNYYVYCVTELISDSPKILRIKNPDFENKNDFRIEPLTYKIIFE